MATIDKPLPNITETVVEVPKQEELVEERDEITERKDKQGNIEVTMDEEGGAEIAFDPRAVTPEGGQDHFENLADFLGDEILEPLGLKMVDHYNEYKESRGDWEDTYRNGLDLLGFKYERRTEPFRGASGVNHPVLAEAVTQFQAQAYKELLPADGPVRTQILGNVDVAKEILKEYNSKVPFVKELTKRVSNFANSEGYVSTIKGRKCRFELWEPTTFGVFKALPEDQAKLKYGKHHILQRAGTYKALNRLIQGSAADQTKQAMIELYKENLIPLIQIHDELTLSFNGEEKTKNKIMELMTHAVKLTVPSKVDCDLGKSWGDAT